MNYQDRWVPYTPLYAADIRPVQLAFKGKRFLRKAFILTKLAKITPHLPPYIHNVEGEHMWTISLWTISLILLDIPDKASNPELVNRSRGITGVSAILTAWLKEK